MTDEELKRILNALTLAQVSVAAIREATEKMIVALELVKDLLKTSQ